MRKKMPADITVKKKNSMLLIINNVGVETAVT